MQADGLKGQPAMSKIATEDQLVAANEIKATVKELNDKMLRGAKLGITTEVVFAQVVGCMAGGCFNELRVSTSLRANL